MPPFNENALTLRHTIEKTMKIAHFHVPVWLVVTVAALVVIIVATIGGSIYMLDYSLSPDAERATDNERTLAKRCKEMPSIRPWVDSLKRANALRDTMITMPTGERHHAYFVYAHRPTSLTAVLVHGYHDCAMGMMQLGYLYHHCLGYNILLPDLHAHGLSEGNRVQMGWKDRFDVLRWTEVADSLFRGPVPHTRMVVHGVSMGAATTMALSGEKTPNYVRAFVEDCGYTSVWDEFSYELREIFGLPDFPLMWTTSALCQLCYGWSFGQADIVRQVAKCTKPMLFIHGTNDTFVPTRMVKPLYQAKRAPKMIYLSRGSIHAKSYRDNPKVYTNQVERFCQAYVASDQK
jgi:fermentation-respiration switch protein FrsA (DUF1100 family)